MSAGRASRRRLSRESRDIGRLIAKTAKCPDCGSTVRKPRNRSDHWRIYHDDGCPQLDWRERHQATREALIIPGAIGPQRDEAELQTVDLIRVGNSPHLSWQERAAIEGPSRDHDGCDGLSP